MRRASKIALDGSLTIVSGPNPPTEDGFCSTRVQVLHWQVDNEFSDPVPHAHADSDEVYVVLEGSIDLVVDGERMRIGPAEAMTVGAGVIHSLVAVDHPAHGLTIRGPAIADKTLHPSVEEPPSAVAGRTTKIKLRAFTPSDVAMVQELATDPYIPLITSVPTNATSAEALAYIDRQNARQAEGVGYSFCIADPDSDQPFGQAGLWIRDLAAGRATAGYVVAPSCRGQGRAAAALRALTTFAWSIAGLDRVELYIEPSNLASIHTAQAAGYRREGRLRSHQKIGGRRRDMIIFAAIRGEDS